MPAEVTPASVLDPVPVTGLTTVPEPADVTPVSVEAPVAVSSSCPVPALVTPVRVLDPVPELKSGRDDIARSEIGAMPSMT